MKPTDRHQYLYFSSARPNRTKCSLVFSQTLRMRRLCSNHRDLEWSKKKMRSWFVKREYSEKLIDSEITKVKFNIKETNRMNKRKNGVSFIVVTYHPLLNYLYSIIGKSQYLLNMGQKIKEVFNSQPMVFFRNARNLVPKKLYPLERRVGSYKYDCSRCQVCHSVTETDIFICNKDQRSYKINHSFDFMRSVLFIC